MKQIVYKDILLFIPDRYYHENLIKRFINNNYEKNEYELVTTYYNKNDYVLEIGSCIGFLTSILSKNVHSVISIEANPELKESMDLCKQKNNLDNVEFKNIFISNDMDFIDFQTYDNIVAGSGDREDMDINNVRGWGHTLKKYKLKCVKLEDIKNIHLVNSLVLDMEGGELNFINNYKKFIKNNIQKICIELHGHLMKSKKF